MLFSAFALSSLCYRLPSRSPHCVVVLLALPAMLPPRLLWFSPPFLLSPRAAILCDLVVVCYLSLPPSAHLVLSPFVALVAPTLLGSYSTSLFSVGYHVCLRLLYLLFSPSPLPLHCLPLLYNVCGVYRPAP